MANEFYVRVSEEVILSTTTEGVSDALVTAGVVISDVGPINPTLITSQKQLLDNYTIGGSLTPSDHVTLLNAYSQLASTNVLLSRSVNTTWTYSDLDLTGTLVPYDMFSRSFATNQYSITIEDAAVSPTDAYVELEGYVFYLGSLPTLANAIRYIEWDGNLAELGSLINVSGTPYVATSTTTAGSTPEEYTLTIHSISPLTTFTSDTYTVGSIPSPTTTSGNPRFAIIPNSIANYSGVSIELKAYNSDLTNPRFYVEYDGVEYLLSMDRADVDNDGISIWAENINDLGLPFQLLVQNEAGYDDVVEGTQNLPTAIGYSKTISQGLNNMQIAMLRHMEQEVAYIDFVSDFGDSSTTMAKTQTLVGDTHFALAVIGFPETVKTKEQAVVFKNGTGIGDNNNAIFIFPNDYSTARTGFRALIGGATLYIELVGQKRSGNIEFSPSFSLLNGTVGAGNLNVDLKKSDREWLIPYRINCIAEKRSGATVATILFNNLTAATVKSVLSEDQNRRLHNRVNRDIKVIMDQFISRYPTPATMADVTAAIESYFENQIMSTTEYKPKAFKVVCSTTNNPPSTQAQGKLFVEISIQYFNAIKFIEVLNRAFDVATDI